MRIDASEFLRDMKIIEERVKDTVREGMDQVAKVAYRTAHETTLFKDRTGELRGTLDITELGPYRRRLIARAKHAKYIEGGTKRHVIRPRDAGGLLRFVIGGRIIFARSVNHPGTAARPFMKNAEMAGSQAMRVIMDDGVAHAVAYP